MKCQEVPNHNCTRQDPQLHISVALALKVHASSYCFESIVGNSNQIAFVTNFLKKKSLGSKAARTQTLHRYLICPFLSLREENNFKCSSFKQVLLSRAKGIYDLKTCTYTQDQQNL